MTIVDGTGQGSRFKQKHCFVFRTTHAARHGVARLLDHCNYIYRAKASGAGLSKRFVPCRRNFSMGSPRVLHLLLLGSYVAHSRRESEALRAMVRNNQKCGLYRSYSPTLVIFSGQRHGILTNVGDRQNLLRKYIL
jgi:hypothetical protein